MADASRRKAGGPHRAEPCRPPSPAQPALLQCSSHARMHADGAGANRSGASKRKGSRLLPLLQEGHVVSGRRCRLTKL
jgi:hypothetical protein